METPADQLVRERALDVSTSFIVQAPAGSGKTALLVQRFLALLSHVEQPESILAITFTRKAAGEMRRRVLAALEGASGPRPNTPHEARTWELAQAARRRDEQRRWNLAECPHRLEIRTTDSFCASLVRRMPWASRVGGPLNIAEDASELYQAAARATVELVESELWSEPLARLLLHLDNDAAALENLLAAMLACRDQWLRHLATDSDAVRASLQAALHSLGCHQLSHAVPDFSHEQWQILEDVMTALRLAVDRLKAEFRARRQVDYIEIAQAALHALSRAEAHQDLPALLGSPIEHILVDEFQDTSFTQYRLLEKLTAGWKPGDGRTLFVVGDPMQSIYRFREAEVGLFLKAAREGIGSVRLEPLQLSVNFRSDSALISWVNQAFPQVLAPQDDVLTGAVRFSPSEPRPQAPQGIPVRVHPFIGRDHEQAEARCVVEIVREIQARDPSASTAVLVRARRHCGHILRAFRQAGLRYRAVEIDALAEIPVVEDLLALTRALLDLADRVAWLAVLRAPWCGLTLAELHTLAGDDHARPIWDLMRDEQRVTRLPAAAQARLRRVRDTLEQCFAHRAGSLRTWVEQAWLGLGGPACAQDAAELDNAQAFLDLLERLEEGGQVDLEVLEEQTQTLWARPDPQAPEALQVMTIHKAKGLEFDAVIVPGLGRWQRADQPLLLAWLELPGPDAAGNLLLAPVPEKGAQAYPLYQFLRDLDKQKAENEAGRLLYVAATRARRELHLLGHTKLDKKGQPSKPHCWSLLYKLWPAVEQDFAAAARETAATSTAQAAATPAGTLRRLAPDWQRPAPPPRLRWPAATLAAAAEVIPEPLPYAWTGQTLRHVGTVVHAILHRIAREGLARWNAARVTALRPLYEGALRDLGVAREELAEAAARVERALVQTLEDARGRWILDEHHAEAENEYALSGLVEGRWVSLRLDRTFVDAEGTRWIVDYKVSIHEGGSLEQFLDAELERYRTQLELYSKLMAARDRRPIRLGLYFPLLGAWREWGAEAARAAI